MRQRRVGTISMGFLLIGLGFALLISRLNGFNELSALKYWPVLLIIIGGEILWYVYRAKEDNVKVRYDIFSIFMVMIIIFTCVGLLGLTQIGIVDKLSVVVNAQDYQLQVPDKSIVTDSQVKKIIIEGPRNCSMTVRATNNKELVWRGKAYVSADSIETAEKLVQQDYIISKKIGEILYISHNNTLRYNDMNYYARLGECTIFVPSNKQVEIENKYPLKVVYDELMSDWFIDSHHNIEILLKDNIDMEITAPNGSIRMINSKENKEDDKEKQERLVIGKGTHKLKVINCDNIKVNNI